MAEDHIKLGLDMGESKQSAIDVAGALDKLKEAAKATGHEGFAELIEKTKASAAAFREQAQAIKDSGEKTKLGFGDIAAGAGGFFTAIKEGNIGSAIKSVTEIVKLVPALNTFAPAIEKAGMVADAAWPAIKEWYEWLSKENKAIVDLTGNITKYTNALEENDAKLRESDALAKARDADQKSKEEVGDLQKDRAGRFGEIIKGNEADVMQEVFDAIHEANADYRAGMEKQIKEKWAGFRQQQLARNPGAFGGIAGKGLELGMRKQERDEIARLMSGEKDQTDMEALMAQAKAGNEAALARISQILPKGTRALDAADIALMQSQDAAARHEYEQIQDKAKQRKAQWLAQTHANERVQARIKSDDADQRARAVQRAEAEGRGPKEQEHQAAEKRADDAKARAHREKAARLSPESMREGDERAWERDAQRRINALGGGRGSAVQDELILIDQASKQLIGENELRAGQRLIQAQETLRKLQQANNVLNGVN